MTATDKHRSFRLSTPLGVDKLLFVRMAGHERLGQPFRLEVTASSADDAIKSDDLLGQPVGVECDLPAGGVRHFHGLVTDFRQLSYGERLHEYEFTLRPWFWFLTQTADCRVFQDLNVRDIFEQVAKGLGFTDYRFELIGDYEK
ncbi:MAG: contractile injection system protein, VgrG/Pvc8 family, partial [Steroidobacteraceae bacterium]